MLKKTLLSLLVIAYCLGNQSCRNRNPNLSKKQLQTLLDDSTSWEVQPVLPDTGYIPPMGAKFKENRTIDPDSPPVTLKISIPTGEKKTLKLSQFGSSIEYVTLQLPNENDFFLSNTKIHISGDKWSQSYGSSTKVHELGDYLLTTDEFGIRLFDKQGNFVQQVLASEFDGDRTTEEIFISFDSYKQAVVQDISDNHCYLALVDYSTKQQWAGIYSPQEKQKNMHISETPEMAPGLKMVPVRNLPSGIQINNDLRFSPRGNMQSPLLAISLNAMGDTLCKFTNHILRDKSKSLGNYSTPDRPLSFRSSGKVYFRQAYNDTIFQIQSESRIVPAYRFDFGNHKVGLEEGLSGQTKGKLIPWRWKSFKTFFLLLFTEGRDCPNCRENEEVKFFCLLYDKQTGAATAIDLKSKYPESALIENDIDNGLPVPLYSLNTRNDRIIATYTKKDIEAMLASNTQNMSLETTNKLRAQAEKLKQNEMMVITVK